MDYASPAEFYKAIADAIRLKTGENGRIKAKDFPQAIEEIITTPAGWHDTSAVTATAANVLSPKKIVDASGNLLTGSIQSEGAGTYSAALDTITTIQTNGKYYTGNQTISAITVENLTAENIKDGVTVNVKSGGNSIKSVTGNVKGQVKKLTKAGGTTRIAWNRHDQGTISLPYVEFSTNEVGFVPDAIICIDSGQLLHQTIWDRRSYSGGGEPVLEYFLLSWADPWLRWFDDQVPNSMSDDMYKIPIPVGLNGRDLNILFMKE